MRHGTSGRRQRNRGSNNGGGGQRRSAGHNRTQVFDSNGPDVRIRGTAFQVHEKYLILAKDAAASGDRIVAESYLQHAEHYQRIINAFDEGVQPMNAPDSSPVSLEDAVDPVVESVMDLSLPTSILGMNAQPKMQAQSARTSEGVMG